MSLISNQNPVRTLQGSPPEELLLHVTRESRWRKIFQPSASQVQADHPSFFAMLEEQFQGQGPLLTALKEIDFQSKGKTFRERKTEKKRNLVVELGKQWRPVAQELQEKYGEAIATETLKKVLSEDWNNHRRSFEPKQFCSDITAEFARTVARGKQIPMLSRPQLDQMIAEAKEQENPIFQTFLYIERFIQDRTEIVVETEIQKRHLAELEGTKSWIQTQLSQQEGDAHFSFYEKVLEQIEEKIKEIEALLPEYQKDIDDLKYSSEERQESIRIRSRIELMQKHQLQANELELNEIGSLYAEVERLSIGDPQKWALSRSILLNAFDQAVERGEHLSFEIPQELQATIEDWVVALEMVKVIKEGRHFSGPRHPQEEVALYALRQRQALYRQKKITHEAFPSEYEKTLLQLLQRHLSDPSVSYEGLDLNPKEIWDFYLKFEEQAQERRNDSTFLKAYSRLRTFLSQEADTLLQAGMPLPDEIPSVIEKQMKDWQMALQMVRDWQSNAFPSDTWSIEKEKSALRGLEQRVVQNSRGEIGSEACPWEYREAYKELNERVSLHPQEEVEVTQETLPLPESRLRKIGRWLKGLFSSFKQAVVFVGTSLQQAGNSFWGFLTRPWIQNLDS